MEDVILQVNHLSKSFGSHEVLRDIDFTVAKGDVTSIIGASGSGKSTLLRCINLLETPTSGEVCYHGKNVAGRGVNAPAYRAHVGMVFQSFNLFNNMTVLKNCMVGQMKVLKRSKEEARQQAEAGHQGCRNEAFSLLIRHGTSPASAFLRSSWKYRSRGPGDSLCVR